MLRDVKQEAIGRWPGILVALGVDAQVLNRKHQPCPVCGGKDRFRFDDKDGRGTYYCAGCGAGDGFKLLMGVKGIEFKDAARMVESVIGLVQPEQPKDERSIEDRRNRLNRMWARSETAGNEMRRYLEGRGLNVVPPSLRWIAQERYYEDGKAVGTYGAMVGKIVDVDGVPVSIHCTYLQDGQKAPVESPKKVMSAVKSINGCAIRLWPAAKRIGVAEGIETAIAYHELFGLPMWATIAEGTMERLELPPTVEAVEIAGDHDANFVGQQAAYALAKRLAKAGIDVVVRMPPDVGDWLDFKNRAAKCG